MKVTRKEFIQLGLGSALAMTSAGKIFQSFAQDASEKFAIEVDKKFYKTFDGTNTQCFICPLNCKLKTGETCFCRTRTNHSGKLLNHAYDNPCVISVDPIEKLPLSHYLPGKETLSLAFGGCNLRCLYCQNWQQSQVKPSDLKNFDLSREKALDGAKKKDIDILACTYTEPIAFYDYVRDLSAYAKEKGAKTVCATALFVNPDPLKELATNVAAFSVALKGFDEKFYDRVCGISLKPVLTAIETLKTTKSWFEIVNLIVPTYNDNFDDVKAMCKWIVKTVGKDVPVHFGRFVPEYKMKDLPRTPVQTLEKCREIAMEEGVRYAYIFNVSPHEGNNTYCHGCKKCLVQRLGFKIIESNLEKGACKFCRTKIPGVWQ